MYSLGNYLVCMGNQNSVNFYASITILFQQTNSECLLNNVFQPSPKRKIISRLHIVHMSKKYEKLLYLSLGIFYSSALEL